MTGEARLSETTWRGTMGPRVANEARISETGTDEARERTGARGCPLTKDKSGNIRLDSDGREK